MSLVGNKKKSNATRKSVVSLKAAQLFCMLEIVLMVIAEKLDCR